MQGHVCGFLRAAAALSQDRPATTRLSAKYLDLDLGQAGSHSRTGVVQGVGNFMQAQLGHLKAVS